MSYSVRNLSTENDHHYAVGFLKDMPRSRPSVHEITEKIREIFFMTNASTQNIYSKTYVLRAYVLRISYSTSLHSNTKHSHKPDC